MQSSFRPSEYARMRERDRRPVDGGLHLGTGVGEHSSAKPCRLTSYQTAIACARIRTDVILAVLAEDVLGFFASDSETSGSSQSTRDPYDDSYAPSRESPRHDPSPKEAISPSAPDPIPLYLSKRDSEAFTRPDQLFPEFAFGPAPSSDSTPAASLDQFGSKPKTALRSLRPRTLANPPWE